MHAVIIYQSISLQTYILNETICALLLKEKVLPAKLIPKYSYRKLIVK